MWVGGGKWEEREYVVLLNSILQSTMNMCVEMEVWSDSL